MEYKTLVRYGRGKTTRTKTTRHVLLRGRHPYEFVKDLRKDTGATSYNARMLLLTETARVQTLASKRHMLDQHGEDAEYEFVAKWTKEHLKHAEV